MPRRDNAGKAGAHAGVVRKISRGFLRLPGWRRCGERIPCPMNASHFLRILGIASIFTAFVATAPADDFTPDPGFISLYNGKDLTGWGYRDKDQKVLESFDGKPEASDGRYSANGEILVVHPHDPARGPRLRQMWTAQLFPKNFILKLEFRAAVNADSGIFLREPQLQCRDYLVAGPYKELKKYKAQDWNTIEVTVTDNVAHCTCNGEVLEEALKLPASGPIGLEGDRAQMEYRHIEIKELP
jgi:hypothetical protein